MTKTKKPQSLSSVILYIACAIVTGIAIAFGMSYLYNDYNTVMQFGLPAITYGQMYLGLVALGAARLWLMGPDAYKKAINSDLEISDLWMTLTYKLFSLVFIVAIYEVVKAIVF